MFFFNYIFLSFIFLIFLFNTGFSQWEVQDPGFQDTVNVVYYHAVDENVVWAVGGREIDQPVYQEFSKTVDGGNTWTLGNVPAGANYFFSNIFALNDSVAWVTMVDNIAGPHEGRIFKTTDGGNIWTIQFGDSGIAPTGYNGFFNWVYFWNETEGLAVADHGHGNRIEIFKTFNGGNSWNIIDPVNIPTTLANEEPTHSIRWVTGDSSIWFSTDKGRIFRSTNRGQSWSASDPGLGNLNVFATFQDELNGIATGPLLSKNIAETTDGGNTWQILSQQLPINSGLIYIKGTPNTYMYTSGNLGYILQTGDHGNGFTFDYGQSYFYQDTIPLNGAAFVNDSTGWAGNVEDNKIYKWNGGSLSSPPSGIALNENIIPNNIILEQNYPNPFNPNTNIEFSIPSSDFVSLKIFNMLGQQVTTLVSENLKAGNYTYSWNAGSLASGVYYYKIQSGSFQKIRKMILLK